MRSTDNGAQGAALAQMATRTPLDALENLRSRPEGLSRDEVEARLAQNGPNELPRAHGPGLVRQLFDQLFHFFALMLWGAAGLAFVGRMPQLGIAIIVVIVVNGVFSFAQEYRAERAVRALSALLPETALVRRAGRKVTVPASELVSGDVVLLREGDRISADARVLRTSELKVDMSMLTGESKPVGRLSEPIAEAPIDALDVPNVVFAGTFVTSGSGVAVVVVTGAATRLGGISRLTAAVVRRPTPLRLQLNRVVRVIAVFAVATGLAFFGLALGVGMAARDGFLFSVGVIVALVPEGLLPTLSLSLAMSATRMARRGALVRRLESVETLGTTTVICTDKTGDDHGQPDDGQGGDPAARSVHRDGLRVRLRWRDPDGGRSTTCRGRGHGRSPRAACRGAVWRRSYRSARRNVALHR